MPAAIGRFLLNMFPLFAVSLGTRAEMPLMPSHRRALQTAVSTSAGLASALANTATFHIVLDPGTYYLSAELSVRRSVVIEAAVAGSVVLDARASSSSRRRVLFIDPGSSGVVQLIGLNFTGGLYTVSVLQMSSCQRHPTDEITPIALTCLPRLSRRLSLSQLRPTLRSTTGCTCRRNLIFSHRPDGKVADVLASTLARTTAADAPVHYREYVPQRP